MLNFLKPFLHGVRILPYRIVVNGEIKYLVKRQMKSFGFKMGDNLTEITGPSFSDRYRICNCGNIHLFPSRSNNWRTAKVKFVDPEEHIARVTCACCGGQTYSLWVYQGTILCSPDGTPIKDVSYVYWDSRLQKKVYV